MRPSHKFSFRSSAAKNGLPGEGRHEGLVPRNNVLTNGFIWFSLARSLTRILFVPRLRSPWKIQKALRTWRRLFALFEAIPSYESLYKFCHCSSVCQLMMLALGNKEKCSRCIQTHTPFTVGSHEKMTVSVRFGTPGQFRELKERIIDRCSTWAINRHNLWAKYFTSWRHCG